LNNYFTTSAQKNPHIFLLKKILSQNDIDKVIVKEEKHFVIVPVV
jgi:hypothetical protein